MVGMIIPGTMKYCPYIQYYIKIFKNNNISYEIISWDKRNLNEPVNHAFKYTTEDHEMLKKSIGYLKFRRWLLELCKKQKYDKIIIFTIAPALLVNNYLAKYYKNMYYLDIRDDTVLRKYVPGMVASVIKDANGIITSSKEFNGWIGRDTTLCHNVDAELVKSVTENGAFPCQVSTVHNRPHRIMFAGGMNEWEINLEMLKKLGNNIEFEFIFHTPDSPGKTRMIEYCESTSVRNVHFYGAYKKEDISEMYRSEADWVNIIRCNSVVNRNALPNKFYDAMVAGVPVIALEHNKAVCDYVNAYKLGLVFRDLDDLVSTFKTKANDFDYAAFSLGRMQFLRDTLSDCQKFESTILKWAKSDRGLNR